MHSYMAPISRAAIQPDASLAMHRYPISDVIFRFRFLGSELDSTSGRILCFCHEVKESVILEQIVLGLRTGLVFRIRTHLYCRG